MAIKKKIPLKGKSGTAVPPPGTDAPVQTAVDVEGEPLRRQLQLEAKHLASQIEVERRQCSELHEDRERLHYLWIVERQKLEDLRAELRNKERDSQDIDERQQIELKVCCFMTQKAFRQKD
eukprot:GHVS01051054.1.p2 GENE.GHVS01051054.1~~GHVS01051054.1.p2  ORF type:complete len:121 (-),score=15.29 GHVS01051054.1:272-634(-)